jgi:catechol 2,3-dioxygenase-like lactoylglutathione lyase family enzyme
MPAPAELGFTARTHISLDVRDARRAAAFYEAFFGVPAHKVRPGYANFELDDPPLKLALQEGGGGGRGALNHLGIQVATPEQVAGARVRLREAGLATIDEGETVCCHARQEKLWVADPDGNLWEIYVVLDDMPGEAPPERASDGTGKAVCCAPEPACCT